MHDDLFSVHNLYNDNRYWVRLQIRKCDCANWEFEVSDTPGGYCKHLKGVAQWVKEMKG